MSHKGLPHGLVIFAFYVNWNYTSTGSGSSMTFLPTLFNNWSLLHLLISRYYGNEQLSISKPVSMTARVQSKPDTFTARLIYLYPAFSPFAASAGESRWDARGACAGPKCPYRGRQWPSCPLPHTGLQAAGRCVWPNSRKAKFALRGCGQKASSLHRLSLLCRPATVCVREGWLHPEVDLRVPSKWDRRPDQSGGWL